MTSRYVLIFLLSIGTAILHDAIGQSINGKAFINKAITSIQSVNVQSIESFNNSWIDEIDIRTETNDFELSRQEYTLRVSPSSLKKRKAQQNYFQALSTSPQSENIELQKDLFKEIFTDWISLYELDLLLNWNEQKSLLLQDKITILEKYRSILEFDFQQMIDLEIAMTDLANDEQKYIIEKDRLLAKYAIARTDTLDYSDLIEIDHILMRLPQAETPKSDSENSHKKLLLQKEWDIEQTEKNQVLDFAQIRYRGPHDNLINERVSLGLGFRLNTSGSKNLKLKELEYRIKQLDTEIEIDRIKTNNKILKTKTELEAQILLYINIENNLNRERTSLLNIADQVQKKEGFNPLTLLKIEERHIESRIKQCNNLTKIYRQYLQYLEQSQKINALTFDTYLSNP